MIKRKKRNKKKKRQEKEEKNICLSFAFAFFFVGRHLFRFGENLKCIAGIDIDCFDRVFVSDTILQDILVFG